MNKQLTFSHKLYSNVKRLIRVFVIGVSKRLPIPIHYSFVMSEPEKALFDRRIGCSKVYLEFGLGGSTLRALLRSKAKIYSVESSKSWIEEMREYMLIRRMEDSRLFIFHVEIGPTGRWGYPEDSNSDRLFPNYSAEVFGKIDKSAVDTVLIDGRFRVACTLKSILELHRNPGLQILIHDFSVRPQYGPVLKYLTLSRQIDSLCIFKVREDVSLVDVEADYHKFKFNPD